MSFCSDKLIFCIQSCIVHFDTYAPFGILIEVQEVNVLHPISYIGTLAHNITKFDFSLWGI